MTAQLTRKEFKKLKDLGWVYFIEYKQRKEDIYKIEYQESFLKCAIQKTKQGVQIIYLGSNYIEEQHRIFLMGYATFIIAYRLNKNKGFEIVTFEQA